MELPQAGRKSQPTTLDPLKVDPRHYKLRVREQSGSGDSRHHRPPTSKQRDSSAWCATEVDLPPSDTRPADAMLELGNVTEQMEVKANAAVAVKETARAAPWCAAWSISSRFIGDHFGAHGYLPQGVGGRRDGCVLPAVIGYASICTSGARKKRLFGPRGVRTPCSGEDVFDDLPSTSVSRNPGRCSGTSAARGRDPAGAEWSPEGRGRAPDSPQP